MEKNYKIRFMEEKDLEQVCTIENAIFSRPWRREDFHDAVADPLKIYLVVDKESEILGYCGLSSVLDEGQITNVAIKQEARSLGYGFEMLQKLLLYSRKKGLTCFTLEVRESNMAARMLYKKLGFEEAGVRPNFYDKPDENAVIMWKY